MADGELVWLAEQASAAPVIIEVGCWKGRATLALADATPGRVFAVDHWRGSDPEHLAEIAAAGPDSVYHAFLAAMGPRIQAGTVIPLRMAAVDAVRLFTHGSVDFVFIDASHAYADVQQDIAGYRALVRPGGILAGHDYAIRQLPGVQQAVDEAFPAIERVMSIWWVRLGEAT